MDVISKQSLQSYNYFLKIKKKINIFRKDFTKTFLIIKTKRVIRRELTIVF